MNELIERIDKVLAVRLDEHCGLNTCPHKGSLPPIGKKCHSCGSTMKRSKNEFGARIHTCSCGAKAFGAIPPNGIHTPEVLGCLNQRKPILAKSAKGQTSKARGM